MTRRNYTTWTADEVEYLKANVGVVDIEEIANHLGRTERAVRGKCTHLGLGATGIVRRPWTAEDDDYLIMMVGNYKLSTIARHLGRTVSALQCRLTLKGVCPRSYIQRIEGMGIKETCRVLGIKYTTTLHIYIRRGYLTTVIRKIDTKVVHSISYDAVSDFLNLHGFALNKVVQPPQYIDGEYNIWHSVWQDIRSDLLTKYVPSKAIYTALQMPYIPPYLKFCPETFHFGAIGGGKWYAKQDITEWLERKPQYRTRELLMLLDLL